MSLRTAVPILACVLLAMPSQSLAKKKPFNGAELITGRGIKPPVETQVVQFGLSVGTSPMASLLGYVKDDIRNRAIQECQAAGISDCAASIKTGMDQLAKIPDATWEKINVAAGTTPAMLDQMLKDAGLGNQQVRGEVVTYFSGTTAKERQDAVGAARIASKAQDSVNLLLEPYVRVNTKWIEVGLSFPFTIRILDGRSDADFGNVTLDLRSGKVWTSGSVHFALTGGVGIYLPSGTRAADESARADLFQAPKTMHQYLGIAPYLVVGVDLAQWLLLMPHIEYLAQIGVRDHYPHSSVQVLKYGLGVVAFPSFFLNILAELNGMTPLKNATAFNVLFFTGGLQAKIAFFRLALAVEVPVWTAERPDNTVIGGVPIGKLSKYNILSRVAFTF